MSTKGKILRLRRSNRLRMRARDQANGHRVRAQALLEKYGHDAIRVRQSRQVIGQPYNHARQDEALVTLRLRRPYIVPAEQLERVVGRLAAGAHSTDSLYRWIVRAARAYLKVRKPVKNQVWRPKGQARKRRAG